MYEYAELEDLDPDLPEMLHLRAWGIGPTDKVCPHESDRIAGTQS